MLLARVGEPMTATKVPPVAAVLDWHSRWRECRDKAELAEEAGVLEVAVERQDQASGLPPRLRPPGLYRPKPWAPRARAECQRR